MTVPETWPRFLTSAACLVIVVAGLQAAGDVLVQVLLALEEDDLDVRLPAQLQAHVDLLQGGLADQGPLLVDQAGIGAEHVEAHLVRKQVILGEVQQQQELHPVE